VGSTNERLKETDLYAPVRDYLVRNGYSVRAEVGGCDVVATQDQELVVVELKTTFSVALLAQATERQRATDSVYVAVPAPKEGRRGRRWRGVRRLLRRLELGLIWVHVRPSGTRVEVVLHPEPYRRQKSSRRRRSIIREVGGRTGSGNVGGSSSHERIVTAYREKAVHIACCLAFHGPLRPAQMKRLGTCDITGRIVYQNHYGWFERLGDGRYALHANGLKALEEYPRLTAHYEEVVRRASEDDAAQDLAGRVHRP
jgi:hypothetical protein